MTYLPSLGLVFVFGLVAGWLMGILCSSVFDELRKPDPAKKPTFRNCDRCGTQGACKALGFASKAIETEGS